MEVCRKVLFSFCLTEKKAIADLSKEEEEKSLEPEREQKRT
jgi:hypothetical protein